MPKTSVRRRLSSKKSGRKVKNTTENATYDGATPSPPALDTNQQEATDATSCVDNSENVPSSLTAAEESSWQDIHFHDYAKPCTSDIEIVVSTCTMTNPGPLETSLLKELKYKVELFMPHNWMPIVEKDGVSVVLMSRSKPRSSQRSLFFDYSGDVEVAVHNCCIDSEQFLKDAPLPVPFSEETINEFVDRLSFIVGKVRAMEVCAGVDNERYESVWDSCKVGFVDTNVFSETRYIETYRSYRCKRLVTSRSWRCEECTKLLRPLRRKLLFSQQEPKPNTPNVFLTAEQSQRKLKKQRTTLDSANKKIRLLQRKILDLVKKEGVKIEPELSDDLSELLKSKNLTPAQEIFLHQQVKASSLSKKTSMQWHPVMIRFALSLHLSAPGAYDELRDTGMIKLPCRRTLFDYTHVKPLVEGIDKVVLEDVFKRVKPLRNYQKYHVLLGDEMYISKNLVFQKSSGKMIGFTKLNEADKEVDALNAFLDDPDKEVTQKQEIASKVMCYMVKGTASGIKEVVASYAVANISANQMYLWTWQVISALECGGVKIVAFVCDGSTTNRAFINLHTPKTKLPSGVVMDTVNKAAPSRTLYFMSDVAHLLKTIRNCFCKSRIDPTKGKRCLRRRGQKIVWDYIIRLYNDTKNRTVRKTYKLSPVHVFPDSYSCMKVCYAAQVLSLSVAAALLKRNYAGVKETVKFIIAVNNWFDQLNGAHSSVGKKKRNANLCPFTSPDDRRFKELENFVTDLDAWKAEAYSLEADLTLNSTVNGNILDGSGMSEADVTFNPVENGDGDEWEDETPAGKRILSHQTLKGIEMTTRSFIDCVKFLLMQGTNFINARVFSQDPLEQHFSKQRMGGGGSTNPNLQKFLWKNRAIHIKGQLGMKRARGNTTEVEGSHVIVTEEPLPKRRTVRSGNSKLV